MITCTRLAKDGPVNITPWILDGLGKLYSILLEVANGYQNKKKNSSMVLRFLKPQFSQYFTHMFMQATLIKFKLFGRRCLAAERGRKKHPI